MKRSARRVVFAAIEPLDTRQLLAASAGIVDGILVIKGTNAADRISVTHKGSNVVARVNKGSTKFPYASVFGIKIITGSGADRIDASKADLPTGVNAGKGSDKIAVGAGNDTVLAGAGRDSVDSGAGNDIFFALRDSNSDTVNAGAGDDSVLSLIDDLGDGLDDDLEDVENVLPVAADDNAQVNAGQSITLDVTANDIDADEDFLDIFNFTQPTHGLVSLNEDGLLVYTSTDPSWSGTDSFTYSITDGSEDAALSTARVSIQVLGTTSPTDPTTPPATPPTIPPNEPPTTPPTTPPSTPSGPAPTSLSISFRDVCDGPDDNLSRFSRGEKFFIEGMFSSNAASTAGMTVTIQFRDDRNPGEWRSLGDTTTRADGSFSKSTNVFTDVNADNVYFRAIVNGTPTLATAVSPEKRLAIGTN